MGFALNPTYAESGNSYPASKKRVWEFFSESGDFVLGNRLASKCLSRENASIPTKTVSGRTVWLSRDPIENVTGELAELLPEGPNLYTYVANNPIRYFDPLGLAIDSVSRTTLSTIARGSVDEITNLAKTVADPKNRKLLEEAAKRLSSKAKDVIAKECKGSINKEFPSQMRDKSLEEVFKLAKQGDKAAQKARKLLNDKRFKK